MASHQSTDQNSKAPRDSGSYLRRNSYSNDLNRMCIQRNGRADPLGSKFNVPPGRPPIHHPPFPHTNRWMYKCPFSPFKYIYIWWEVIFISRPAACDWPGLSILSSLSRQQKPNRHQFWNPLAYLIRNVRFIYHIRYWFFSLFFYLFLFFFSSFLPGRHN